MPRKFVTVDGTSLALPDGVVTKLSEMFVEKGDLAVTPGAAVSGANTGDQDLSGLIPKSIVDAKGDLLVGTADNTPARLAVGAGQKVLTPDPAAARGLAWTAQRILTGTGSPFNTVTPDYVGQLYSDLNQTNGARVWIATTALSSGWKMADGDTGWRDVSADVLTAFWDTTGLIGFRIRRVGDRVHGIIQVKPADVLDGTALAGWRDFYAAIPAGFRPVVTFNDEPLASLYLGGATSWLALLGTGLGKLSITTAGGTTGNWADTTRVTGRPMWVTDQAWPTSLPGTAV